MIDIECPYKPRSTPSSTRIRRHDGKDMQYAYMQPRTGIHCQWRILVTLLYIGGTICLISNLYGLRGLSNAMGVHPRMMLLQLGVFGDPSTLPLKTLLSRAFEMFKTWRKQHKVPCSQKRFTPGLVIKKVHGCYLSAKAYNGRVILEWLAELSRDYAANNPSNAHVSVQAAALKLG